MEYRIYKYPFEVADVIDLVMPRGAEILTIQTQGRLPTIWAKVCCDGPTEHRVFRCYGTGHPIDPALHLIYVGTFQLMGGNFIGHLFEVTALEGMVQCKDCAHIGTVTFETLHAKFEHSLNPALAEHYRPGYIKAPFCFTTCAIMDLSAKRRCGCFKTIPGAPSV